MGSGSNAEVLKKPDDGWAGWGATVMQQRSRSSMTFGRASIVSLTLHFLLFALLPYLYSTPHLEFPEKKRVNLVVLRTLRRSVAPEKAGVTGNKKDKAVPVKRETKPAKSRPAETKPAKSRPAETRPIKTKTIKAKTIKAKPAKTKKISSPAPVLPPVSISSPAPAPLSSKERRSLVDIVTLDDSKPVQDIPVYTVPQTERPVPQEMRDGAGDTLIDTVTDTVFTPPLESVDVPIRRSSIPVTVSRTTYTRRNIEFEAVNNHSAASPSRTPPQDKNRIFEMDSSLVPLGQATQRRRLATDTISRQKTATVAVDQLLSGSTLRQDETGTAQSEGETAVGVGSVKTIPPIDVIKQGRGLEELHTMSVHGDEKSSDVIFTGGRVQVDPGGIEADGVSSGRSVQVDSGEIKAAEGKITTRPRLTHFVKPVYPEWAERAGKEGKVRLRLNVSSAGKVERVTVEENTAGEVLAASAREAAYQWKFEPVVLSGGPVDVEVFKTIYFILETRQ